MSLQYKKIEFSKSPLQQLFKLFLIEEDTLEFKELYYVKGIGYFTSKECLSHQLFLIELKENTVPTSFCYDFFKKTLLKEKIVEVSTLKWVNEFLYNKDIPIAHSFKHQEFEKNECYVLQFENEIIGIGRCDLKKKFMLNIENVSSYLFE